MIDNGQPYGLISRRKPNGGKVAGLNEMALGIATALAGVAPEPLRVQMRGQSLDQAAYLIRAILRECSDAGIQLRRVAVDDELFGWLTEPGSEPLPCTLSAGAEPTFVEFFRQAPKA
jgi:hypothetical protein